MFNLNPIAELDVKRSRLTQGHHLNISVVLEAQCHTYQVTRLGAAVRDFNGFYHKWAWQPFWPCDPTNFLSSHKLSYTCTKFIKYSQQLRLQTVGQRHKCQKKNNNDFPFSEEGRGGCLAG